MVQEPAVKRVVAFVDGQNLYHAAQESFGSPPPETDVGALARSVCARRGWRLAEVRYYTGVPGPRENPDGHRRSIERLAALARRGVRVFSRPLRYRPRVVRRPDGSAGVVRAGQEKGIDVRIALDVLDLAHRRAYDVALLFSQDQDLSEAAADVRRTAAEQRRWIRAASAFPCGPRTHNRRGIDGTDWIPIDRPTFDACRLAGPARPGSGASPAIPSRNRGRRCGPRRNRRRSRPRNDTRLGPA